MIGLNDLLDETSIGFDTANSDDEKGIVAEQCEIFEYKYPENDKVYLAIETSKQPISLVSEIVGYTKDKTQVRLLRNSIVAYKKILLADTNKLEKGDIAWVQYSI